MTASLNTFVDIHVLQTVPPSCINRDDTGSPKSAVYGGVQRARVSSQAWKRATRRSFENFLNSEELGERTIRVVERIADQVKEISPETTVDDALTMATDALTATGIKVEKKTTKGSGDTEKDAIDATKYLVFLSRGQIQALAELAVAQGPGNKPSKSAAQAAMKNGSSVDVALFGRMIADAPELNVDAACQVSHAISVHEVSSEFDYFTAVDDNSYEDNAGAGMIGTVEFNSSTLYRYATIDVPRLVENLGSAEAALRAVDAFIRSFVLSMPTGKQNTFANRTRPGLVMVQIREDQPTNLVAAFEDPVRSDDGVLPIASTRLLDYAAFEDSAYGTHPVSSSVMVADTNAKGLLDSVETVTFDELVGESLAAVETRLVGA